MRGHSPVDRGGQPAASCPWIRPGRGMGRIRWRLSVRGRGRYRESHLCRGGTTHAATDRRLGALGRGVNDCRERVQIIRFCLRSAKRPMTFTAASAGPALLIRHATRRSLVGRIHAGLVGTGRRRHRTGRVLQQAVAMFCQVKRSCHYRAKLYAAVLDAVVDACQRRPHWGG